MADTQVGEDTFVDTNGVLLDAHTPTGSSGSLTGWENLTPSSDFEIQSNRVEATTNVQKWSRSSTDLDSDLIQHRALMRRPDPEPAGTILGSVVIAASSLATARAANLPGLHAQIIEVFTTTVNIRLSAYDDDGSETTNLASTTQTMSPGDSFYIGVRREGASVSYFMDTTGASDRTSLGTLTLSGSEIALYDDGNHQRVGMVLRNGMANDTSIIHSISSGSAATIPSASTLSSVVSGSYQVSSEWSSVDSVTGYRLEKRGPSDTTFSTVSSTETSTFTSYLEGGLASGSTYTYAVVSFNTYGDGPRSSVVTVVTDPGVVPSASTLSSIPLSTSRTSSEWSSSDSVVGYKFQRQGPSDATFNTIFGSALTGYIDTGLTSFSSYTYGVVSYNTEGDGARSNLVALRTAEVFAPPPDVPPDPWTPTGDPNGPGQPGAGGVGTAAAGTVNATTGGPWARAYPQSASSDGGVDYELQARQEFAFSISSDRPHAIVSSISEGRP